MAVDPKRCLMMAGMAPFGCDWCGKQLTKRQKRWCSGICIAAYRRNHVWRYELPSGRIVGSRYSALARDHHECVRCGCKTDLEVNHIVPLGANKSRKGHRFAESCDHHQSNLETLCRKCHQETTNEQRASGIIGQRRKR